jgi:tetratricopeptide (TPR) repeat protein
MRRFRLRPNPGRVDRAPGSAPAEPVASAREADGPSVLREADGPSVLRETDAPSAPPALARHDRLRWDQRRVAVLRVVFPASAGSAWSSAGRALTVVLDKIEGFGGRVEGLSPTTLEATFGIDPVDDGPRRAAHAALAISRAADRARGRDPDASTPSLVIHTGRVLVARMGQSSHVRQDTKESLFQVARALSARATAGEILLSASAAAFLERRFALTPVDPGEVSSERPCRLVSHERSGLGLWGTPSPFVGRRDEMARLRARARTALDGSGQLVAIGGEAGVGKSRLIWEFTRDAGQGWHRVEATCAGGGRNLYHLAAELLKAFFNVGPDEPIGALRARIDAELVAFDEHLRSTMPALLALLDIATDDAQWARLDPEGRRRGIIGALTGLFVAASRFQPLLLAVEDVHWIDVESQAALEAIATGLGSERILLLVSYRPEYRDPWGHLGHYTGLPLDPLPVGDASELLDTLMGEAAALAPLKGKMIAWTDGNPFFLEETVRSLVESGALAGQRGAYQLVSPVDRLEVPATVEEVLAARIERLLPEDRSVLQTAALIGPVAPLPILRSVVEIDEGRLGAALRRLQVADFIIERITAGSAEISFRHALTHEVAKSSLLPDAQHDLHARVLGAMESLYPRPVGEQVDHLAHHAVGGAVWDKALLYARLAGDRALQSFAAGKAVEYFGHAMGALGHLEKSRERLVETVDLHLRLRDALWPLGRLQEILERLQEAEALAAQAEDTRRQGWIACYLAHYHWSAAENEQALAAAERARLIGDALGDPALAAETGFYLGITCLALGDNRRAVQVLRAARPTLDRAITTSQGSFPSPRFALSGRPLLCSWLARSLAELGQFPEGFAVAWEGHQIAEADGSPFGVIAAVSGMGFLYLRKGEPGRARESLEQALELCRTYTFQNWIPTVTANLGLAYVGLGRLAEGIVLLQHSADVSARTKIGATSTLWRIYLAEAYLRDGRCALAGEVARDALALSLGRRERGHEARARWLLGEIEMCGTDPTGGPAEAMYADALGLAGDLGMRPLLVHCHLGLARLHERGGRSTEAHAHRERGAAVAAEIEMALPTG